MSFDQSKIRENLLAIYAKNSLKHIDDDLIYQTFYGTANVSSGDKQKAMEELKNDMLYLNNKNLLDQFKAQIEKKTQNILTVEQEVKIILSEVVLNRGISFAFELNTTSSSDMYNFRMQLLHDLVWQQYVAPGKWDKRLADHFEFVFPVLKDWYSFFFSYTNKGGALVNKRFESILSSLIDIASPTNQVARFVAGELRDESNPLSFIDEREIETGAPLQHKIDEALKVSYTFVQFISKETFLKRGDKNWCLYEFDEFKKSMEKKAPADYQDALQNNMFFLVVGENLNEAKPAILLWEYENWYNEIGEEKYEKFCSAPVKENDKDDEFQRFRDTIHNVAVAIVGAQTRLINAIPPARA